MTTAMKFDTTIRGDSGKDYRIYVAKDGVVVCSCPAWKFQKLSPAKRSCKHIDRVFAALKTVKVAA